MSKATIHEFARRAFMPFGAAAIVACVAFHVAAPFVFAGIFIYVTACGLADVTPA